LLAGVWKSRRIRNKIDKGRRLLCISKEDIKDMMVICSETRNTERNYEVKNSLAMNEEVGSSTIRCTNKPLVIDLGRYLDKVLRKWFSKMKCL